MHEIFTKTSKAKPRSHLVKRPSDLFPIIILIKVSESVLTNGKILLTVFHVCTSHFI